MHSNYGWCSGIVDVQEADWCIAYTMDAEFIAASHAGREILGMRGLFGELDMKFVEPMLMWIGQSSGNQEIAKREE